MRLRNFLAIIFLAFGLSACQAEPNFDGKGLCLNALNVLKEAHMELYTQDKSRAFEKNWAPVCNSPEMNDEKYADRKVAEMLSSLGQRFDYYHSPDATKNMQEQLSGQLFGIGAEMGTSKAAELLSGLPQDAKPQQMKEAVKKARGISADNSLRVEGLLENGPAEKAGLKKGDLLRRVDGIDLNGKSIDDAIKLIKGPAGSSVTLSVDRNESGVASTLEIKVTRAAVALKEVKYEELPEGVAYIKLKSFESGNTDTEMAEALQKAAGKDGLIIDLRNNPGGQLPKVLNIVGMILEDGPVMVTHHRFNGQIVTSEIALNKNFLLSIAPPSEKELDKKAIQSLPRPPVIFPAEKPIIVLVNEMSASASEILSGSLQYNHRATIIGMPTYGKGVTQVVAPLPYGRSMSVTTDDWTPGRRANDWIGIVPDIEIASSGDPRIDAQLDKAKAVMAEQIARNQAGEAERKKLFEEKHKAFEKWQRDQVPEAGE